MPLQFQIATSLFIILAICVTVLPPKSAILAWLVTSNLTGIVSDSYVATNSLNFIGFTSALALPMVLLIRLRHLPSRLLKTFGGGCWVALALYALVATIWSPEPLSGIKMFGHLSGIFIELVVLERAVAAGIVDRKMIFRFSWCSLLLAVFHWIMDATGTMVGDIRFGSYVTAQQYAALIAALIALVLWEIRESRIQGLVLAACLMCALILNGSRTWALGALISMCLIGAMNARRKGGGVIFLSLLVILLSAAVVLSSQSAGNGRILATVTEVNEGARLADSPGLGTYRDRQATYEAVVDEIYNSSGGAILFGHGTSSGGRFTLGVFHTAGSTVLQRDPNRSIHDEWLRALYEWGVVGLILTLGAIASIICAGIKLYFRQKTMAIPLLAFLPGLCLGLSTENIFAGAGNAATMGAALVLATTILSRPRVRHAAPVAIFRRRVKLNEDLS